MQIIIRFNQQAAQDLITNEALFTTVLSHISNRLYVMATADLVALGKNENEWEAIINVKQEEEPFNHISNI